MMRQRYLDKLDAQVEAGELDPEQIPELLDEWENQFGDWQYDLYLDSLLEAEYEERQNANAVMDI